MAVDVDVTVDDEVVITLGDGSATVDISLLGGTVTTGTGVTIKIDPVTPPVVHGFGTQAFGTSPFGGSTEA